jgi:hypothetical protein
MKKKICRNGVLPGYWKRGKIGLIPKYHPDDNLADYAIEEIEVDEGNTYPKLIDPSNTSLTEIKEICEYNNIPFFWVTGLSSGDRGNINIQKTDSLEKVIDLFIALNSAGSTSTQYRRFFDRLIKHKVIDPAWTIAEYDEKRTDVSDEAAALSKPKTKEGEGRYKSRYILLSFDAFLDDPTQFEIKKTTGNYQSKRRKDFLSDDEAKVFFPALKKINPDFELLGRILRYYNREMFENPKEGFIVPLEALLRLQSQYVGDHNVPHICSHKMGRSIEFGLYLEDELFLRLVELSKKTDQFVFQNKYGGPIDSSQVRRAFRKASKMCGLRDITPSYLC